MQKTTALLGYGEPSKQQALLFNEVVLIESNYRNYSDQSLRDYLIENGVCRLQRITFDRRSIDLREVMNGLSSNKADSQLASLAMLISLWGSEQTINDEIINHGLLKVHETIGKFQYLLKNTPHVFENDSYFSLSRIFDAVTMLCVILLNEHSDISPTGLLRLPPIKTSQQLSDRRQHILDVTISRVPVPSDQTPWEAIIDFRNDPDASARYLCLKRWMNKLARDTVPISEIEDEIDYLLAEYERHMNLHRMKFRHGTLRSIITMPFEIAENVVKLKWKDIPDIPFKVAEHKIALLEAEMKAPGQEVSYLVKAQERFLPTKQG